MLTLITRLTSLQLSPMRIRFPKYEVDKLWRACPNKLLGQAVLQQPQTRHHFTRTNILLTALVFGWKRSNNVTIVRSDSS